MKYTIIFVLVSFVLLYTLINYLRIKEESFNIVKKIQGGEHLAEDEQAIYDKYAEHFKKLGEINQAALQNCINNKYKSA